MKAKLAGLALIMGLAMASQAQARTFASDDDDRITGFARSLVVTSYEAVWKSFDRYFFRGAQFSIGNNDNCCTPGPIPEPETYAMMLAGLGLMGAIARRRKNSGR